MLRPSVSATVWTRPGTPARHSDIQGTPCSTRQQGGTHRRLRLLALTGMDRQIKRSLPRAGKRSWQRSQPASFTMKRGRPDTTQTHQRPGATCGHASAGPAEPVAPFVLREGADGRRSNGLPRLPPPCPAPLAGVFQVLSCLMQPGAGRPGAVPVCVAGQGAPRVPRGTRRSGLLGSSSPAARAGSDQDKRTRRRTAVSISTVDHPGNKPALTSARPTILCGHTASDGMLLGPECCLVSYSRFVKVQSEQKGPGLLGFESLQGL